jgi:hypothetical protein
VRVRHPGGQDIDLGVDDAAVPGVFDLLDILDRIVDGFDDGALAQPEFIGQRHPLVAQVLADLGDQVLAPPPQDIEELLGEITPIPHQLTAQPLGQLRDRLAVIDVAGGDPAASREKDGHIEDHEKWITDWVKAEALSNAAPGSMLVGCWLKYLRLFGIFQGNRFQ